MASIITDCPLCVRRVGQSEETYAADGSHPDDRRVPVRIAGEIGAAVEQFNSKAPLGFLRRRECQSCRGVWGSVELPHEFVEELVRYVAETASLFQRHSRLVERLAGWEAVDVVKG